MKDAKLLMSIYEMMHKIRHFEETALGLFQENKLRGSVHLCTGEEAISATIIGLLRDDDYITSTHRGHGHGIAKSDDLKKAMAELMGKETGFCQGRGGSMHIADLSKGNLGANAIVGAGMPIAVGGALAQKMKGTDGVAVTFFGDGASNQGTFHESMNLAAVWKLPCIFVCENNGFAISVPQSMSTSVKDIALRAQGYGIPGEVVDGNDVLAIMEVTERALERARKGEGPTLIECKTYRWRGHWTGDPEVYRTKDEIEEKMKDDCIARFGKYLVDNKIATEAELAKIDSDILAAVNEAVDFAINSPEPNPATVMDYVFCEPNDAK